MNRMASKQQTPHEMIERFELCEQFADYCEVPVDYVWQEFGDPAVLTAEELMEIFTKY